MKNKRNVIVFALLTLGLAIVVPLLCVLILNAISLNPAIESQIANFLMFVPAVTIIVGGIILWHILALRKEVEEMKNLLKGDKIDK